MNKLVKRIFAATITSAVALTVTLSAFALSTSETVSNTTTVNGVSYTTIGTNVVTGSQYSHIVDLSTYISNSASYKADTMHTHWQLCDYWTGDNIGTKQEHNGYNTNRVDGHDIASLTYYSDITVFASHSAYKNGQTLLADYTTTTN